MSSELISDVAPNLDRYSIIFAILVFVLAISGTLLLNGSAAIALVSAVTASVAIYQLRRPDKTTRPSVRQSFTTNGSGSTDFGLQNYGPGPALYLQLEVTIASTGRSILTIGPRDPPIHLSEEEFIGFLSNERIDNDEFVNLISDIENTEVKSDEMIDLYYSYVSSTGMREPEALNVKEIRDDEDILQLLKDESQNPRRMEISKIRSYCTNAEQDHPSADLMTTK
ncbi:hypothetical protein [Natrinema salinisoli]|uniref:hypothetical protein n=1 Tax=Natrinema salinisoli TaxID=2878535 RepID=UPI001CEFC941|nr:hypothetical protein [Natrinema salinisoli]